MSEVTAKGKGKDKEEKVEKLTVATAKKDDKLMKKIEKLEKKEQTKWIKEYVKVFNAEIVEISEDRAVIHWRRCPVPTLIPEFKDIGLSEDYLETVCSILELFDNGFVEGWNPDLEAQTPPQVGETHLQKKGEFCTVIITKKDK